MNGTGRLEDSGAVALQDMPRERFEMLKALDLKTGRAWAIKENLRELWNCLTKGQAREHWRDWHAWAVRSKLEPVRDKARMLKAHIENVLTYYDHPITNALTEAVNSTILMIKKQAYGFGNKNNFKFMT